MREEQQIPSRSKVNDDDEDEAIGWIRENDTDQDFNYDDADMDGWGEEENESPLVLQNVNSVNDGKNNDTVGNKVLNQAQIEKMIPQKLQEANELLQLNNNDKLIAILRHFNWNQQKLEEQWFEDSDNLEYKIGLKFDKKLI